jgi:hypothetical protein
VSLGITRLRVHQHVFAHMGSITCSSLHSSPCSKAVRAPAPVGQNTNHGVYVDMLARIKRQAYISVHLHVLKLILHVHL